MRLSDVLELPVIDQHGRRWGAVHDLHLVQDGILLANGQAAFRVHGLVAGRAAFATRLGYAGRPGCDPATATRGPLPVRWLVRRLHRDARYIAWAAVTSVEPGRVLVHAPDGGFQRAGG